MSFLKGVVKDIVSSSVRNSERGARRMEEISNDENRSENDRLRAAEIAEQKREAAQKGKELEQKLKNW